MRATGPLTVHLSPRIRAYGGWPIWMTREVVSVVANVNDRIDGNNSEEAANDFSPIIPRPNT
jgi:hypothetical protein